MKCYRFNILLDCLKIKMYFVDTLNSIQSIELLLNRIIKLRKSFLKLSSGLEIQTVANSPQRV